MIQWKDDYKIGIEKIDEQHKKLFEIANRAYDILTKEIVVDKYDKVADVIEELREYTSYHFKTEEDYMLKIGYKRFLSQKAARDEFIKKIYGINLDDISENDDKQLLDILEFVVNWISGHILGADKLICEG